MKNSCRHEKFSSLAFIVSTVSVFALLYSFSTFAAENQDPLKIFAGGIPSHVAAEKLPISRYEPVTLRRLANPRLVWLNIPFLKEHGYDVSQGNLNNLSEKMLNAASWAVPDSLTGGQEQFTLEETIGYADYYGGTGTGENLGSARAAIVGGIQLKGVGMTPLLKLMDEKHTGRSTVHESFKDAVWGETLNRKLPDGAVRIIAVIDRGVLDSNGEPEFIEVRELPLRPAHYMVVNDWLSISKTISQDDITRTQESLSLLVNALPQPKTAMNAEFEGDADKIASGILELINRISMQYARLTVYGIHHGAITPSNIEITGKALDFGTTSAQPGYQAIRFREGLDSFGLSDSFFKIGGALIRAVLLFGTESMKNNVYKYLKVRTGFTGPENMTDGHALYEFTEKFEQLCEQRYLEYKKVEIFRIFGFPETMIHELIKNHSKFAEMINHLIFSPIENHWYSQKTRISLENLESMDALNESSPIKQITALAYGTPDIESTKLKQGLENIFAEYFQYPDLLIGMIGKMPTPEEFATEMLATMQSAAEIAKRDGVTKVNLVKVMKLKSSLKTRPLSDLYMPNLRKQTKSLEIAYKGGKYHEFGAAMDRIISSSIREAEFLGPYDGLVEIKSNGLERSTAIIFNAQLNRNLEKQTTLMKFSRPEFGIRCESLFIY